MTKTLQNSEKEELLSLYLSKAIEDFPYLNEDFFEKNGAVLKERPSSSQLNGLWQMALNAKDIDEMCNEIIRKVSKATLPEWRVRVTLDNQAMELWKFLAQSLIHIRDARDTFMNEWITQHQYIVNDLLRGNGYNGIDSITLSNDQRLELARSFIHRFVSKIIIERKMREG